MEELKSQSFDNTLNEDDYKYLKQLDDKFLNDFDPSDDTTNFTDKDYAELQHNLILYKDGNREATEYIISAFHRILHTYAHFIVLRKIPYVTIINQNGVERSVINQSILSFIRLFGNKNKDKSDKSIRDVCEYIYTLFSKYEYGDIYNELVLALLNMANKYKIITDPNDPKYKPNGTFHVYVKKCFHYEAFYFLKQLTKDPLMNMNILSLTTEDENDYDENINNVSNSTVLVDEKALFEYNTIIDYIDRKAALEKSNRFTLKEDNIDIYSYDSLNFNWINGIVCGPIFKSLTPYERELLVLSYAKNQTEDNLANLYGYSRSTIGSHKRRAIEKLKEAMKHEKDSNNY